MPNNNTNRRKIKLTRRRPYMSPGNVKEGIKRYVKEHEEKYPNSHARLVARLASRRNELAAIVKSRKEAALLEEARLLEEAKLFEKARLLEEAKPAALNNNNQINHHTRKCTSTGCLPRSLFPNFRKLIKSFTRKHKSPNKQNTTE